MGFVCETSFIIVYNSCKIYIYSYKIFISNNLKNGVLE